jgi:hypothetical protein
LSGIKICLTKVVLKTLIVPPLKHDVTILTNVNEQLKKKFSKLKNVPAVEARQDHKESKCFVPAVNTRQDQKSQNVC